MAKTQHVMRNQSEFAVVTVRLFCEKDGIDAAIHAAAESDGCIFAETVHPPRPLRPYEWDDVDEIVNLVTQMVEGD